MNQTRNSKPPFVVNVPRIAARTWKTTTGDPVWISIYEPDQPESNIHNAILERHACLKIPMWDLTTPVPLVGKGEIAYPPSARDAAQIVGFLEEHKGRNLVVNCAAGVSRSGAVAAFCHFRLGYNWLEIGREHALPNQVLLGLLDEEWKERNKES